jgi:hypothetical protein
MLFDLPLFISGPAIILALCGFGLGGLFLVRHHVLPRLRIENHDSEFSGAMLQSIMVFYGLAVALIAVSVWQTYSDVSKVISQEATALAALYRDMSGYPEPTRSQIQKELRGYVDYTINKAWPVQRRGQVPFDGVIILNRLQDVLLSFEPKTEGQKILHGETLRAYNVMIQARRLRLDAVGTALAPVMWVVIIAGAVIALSASFMISDYTQF